MEENNKRKVNRRDVLKSLATLPVLGAAAYGVYKKRQYEQYRNSSIADEIRYVIVPINCPASERKVSNDKEIRIGIIGYGIRGKMLAAGLGFAHPDEVEDMIIGAQYNKDDHRYELLKSWRI